LELTPRTDYVVNGPQDCLVLLSARRPDGWGSDAVFCVRTTDGGRSFRFVSWVIRRSDPFRAVMPSTARCACGRLVCALRRRDLSTERCWIDAYSSDDGGENWAFRSRVEETGGENGNPPALLALRDGRLCCVYGNRTRRQLLARLSEDEGLSRGPEITLRDDYASVEDDADLGYPRAVQRDDGCLVILYYWATRARPQQHIAATIWDPGPWRDEAATNSE
jgi:hypothetical protein